MKREKRPEKDKRHDYPPLHSPPPLLPAELTGRDESERDDGQDDDDCDDARLGADRGAGNGLVLIGRFRFHDDSGRVDGPGSEVGLVPVGKRYGCLGMVAVGGRGRLEGRDKVRDGEGLFKRVDTRGPILVYESERGSEDRGVLGTLVGVGVSLGHGRGEGEGYGDLVSFGIGGFVEREVEGIDTDDRSRGFEGGGGKVCAQFRSLRVREGVHVLLGLDGVEEGRLLCGGV